MKKDQLLATIAVLADITGLLISLFEIIDFLNGNSTNLSFFTLGFAFCIILGSLIWVAFAPQPRKIYSPVKTKRIPRYPQLYKGARLFLIFFLLASIGVFIKLQYREKELGEKFVILITNFDRESSNYQVTDQLIAVSKNAVVDFPETLVSAVNDSITETEGSAKAKKIGEEHHADIVLWGWYSITETDVLLTIHVENFTDSKQLPLIGSELYMVHDSIGSLNNFQVTEKLSNEMVSLSLFLSGMLQFEAENYENAIDRFSAAIQAGEWADDLLSQSLLYYYRGKAYLLAENEKAAIQDCTIAIEINNQDVEAYLVRALSYKINREYDNAINDYEMALSLNSKNIEALLGLGKIYSDVERYSEAEELFTRVASTQPNNQEVHLALGKLYFYLGEYQKAIHEASTAIELDPLDTSAYRNRAWIYLNDQEYEKALEDYNNAISINSNEANSFNGRGLAYIFLKEYEKAIQDFLNVVEFDPKYNWGYWNLAWACEEGSQLTECLEIFNKKIANSPNIPSLYLFREALFQYSGDYGAALDDLFFALDLDPTNSYVYAEIGALYSYQGDFDLAETYISKSIELDPEYPFVYARKAYHLLNTGDIPNAISAFDYIVYLDIHYQNAYLERGKVYYDLGDYGRAMNDISRAVRLGPIRPSALTWRGKIYAKLGDYDMAFSDFAMEVSYYPNGTYISYTYTEWGIVLTTTASFDEAITMFTKAIEIDPDYQWAYASRGDLYRILGEYENAIADFQKAIEIDPEYTYAINELGRIYQNLDLPDDAIKMFTQAIKVDPNYQWAYANRGYVYQEKGDYEKAIDDFLKAVSIDPFYRYAMFPLGQSYMDVNEMDKAIEIFSLIIEAGKDYVYDAHFNRGNAYRVQNKIEQAKADYMIVIENSNNPYLVEEAKMIVDELNK